MAQLFPESQETEARLVLARLSEKIAALPDDYRGSLAEECARLKALLTFPQLPAENQPDHVHVQERLLALFIEFAPAAIAMFDREMRYIAASRRYLEDYRVKDENVIGRSHYEIFPEIEQMQHWKEFHRRCLAGAVEKCDKEPFPRADGTTDWVRWEMQPWYNDLGEIGGILLFTELITDEVEAQQALFAAQTEAVNERNRLVAIMEALPVAVAILDEKGGALQSNRAYDEMWGSPRPIPSSVDDYGPYKAWWVESGARVKPEEWASALAVQKGESCIGQLFEIERFSGDHRFILNSGAPVRDPQGKIIGSAVALVDITDMRKAEEAVRESEARFRVALSALDMVVFRVDREARYTWIHRPRFNRTAEEILGKRDNEIYPPEIAGPFYALKKEALENGKSVIREISILTKGVRYFFLVSLLPVHDSSGKLTGLVGASLNITEQREMEQQHRATITEVEAQRRLMAAREQDRQSIAREIHDGPVQTLSSIGFTLQLFKRKNTDPGLEGLIDEVAQGVKDTIEELRDMMNEIRPPAVIRFGLSKATSTYIEELRERHPAIRWDFELEGKPEQILPDQVCLTLYRVMQEAVLNILRHSRARQVSVRLEQGEKRVSLSVRDDGIGIHQEIDLAKLTDQGHYGLTSIVERVKSIGGVCSIQSYPGQGTSIEINVDF